MTQVWLIDKDNFFIGESKFVEEIQEGMTTIPLLVGYVKPKLIGDEWIEGATEEEIKEWEEANKIDICPEPDEIYILSEQVLELEARNLLQEETQEELTNYVLELDTRVTTIETL